MAELFKIKNKVRDVIRKYEEIIFPVLRLIWCYLVFSNIHSMFHYMDLLDRKIVIFLIAVLVSVLPEGFLLFAAGVVIGVNCYTVNIEVGLAFTVLFMVMYCLYLRFFPKFSYAIFLVTICYSIGMPYLAPMVILVLAGIGGALPAAFGVMLHYFANAVTELNIQLTAAEDDSKVAVLGYFIDHIVKNKEMYMMMLVFALTIVLASIIYKLSFPFSHYAAIAAAAVFCIILTLIMGAVLKETPDTSAAMGGSLLGMLICLVLEVCKGVLDFKHVQRVQFEDDEYYYYVKAIPKLDAPKKKKKPLPKKPQGGRPPQKSGQGKNPTQKPQGEPQEEDSERTRRLQAEANSNAGRPQGERPAGEEREGRALTNEERIAREQERTAIRSDGAPAKRIARMVEEAKKNRPVETPQETQVKKKKQSEDDFEDPG